MLLFIGRSLSSNKYLLVLILALNLHDFLEQLHIYEFKRFPFKEFHTNTQIEQCNVIFKSVEYDYASSLHNIFSYLMNKFGSRRKTQIFRQKDGNAKIIAKTYTKSHKIFKQLTLPLNRQRLKSEYEIHSPPLDFELCPHESIAAFVNFFSVASEQNEITIWLFMLTDAQLILQPYLEGQGFPVPRTFAVCGFTLYQEHVGRTLQHFSQAHFTIKLRIAKQLLDAALKFTYGFNGYRIYITDITADNLVYNLERNKLYFIDLNTVYIVNAKSTLDSDGVDKHDFIECDNCFAFVPESLCTKGLSDLNLLESCLFLRENLKGERAGGFLQPIPAEMATKYPNLVQLLDDCVEGAVAVAANNSEMSRFTAAINLIQLLASILNED